jgi:small subunit ribosomal protein S20
LANTSSAKKRIRQSEKRRQINSSARSAVRTAVKKLRAALENKETPKDDLTAMSRKLDKTVDTAARKGLIHWKTAARFKSRLSGKVAKIS